LHIANYARPPAERSKSVDIERMKATSDEATSRTYTAIDIDLTHFYSTHTWSTLLSRPSAAAMWKDALFKMSLDHPVS
jgi:hypothetical protein